MNTEDKQHRIKRYYFLKCISTTLGVNEIREVLFDIAPNHNMCNFQLHVTCSHAPFQPS